MYDLFLYSIDKERLIQNLKNAKDIRIWKRLKAIQLLSLSYTHTEVSEILDINLDTITNWIKAFNSGKFRTLSSFKYRPPRSSLDPFTKQIRQLIRNMDIRSLKSLQTEIANKLNIQIGKSGLYKWCKKNSIKLG